MGEINSRSKLFVLSCDSTFIYICVSPCDQHKTTSQGGVEGQRAQRTVHQGERDFASAVERPF